MARWVVMGLWALCSAACGDDDDDDAIVGDGDADADGDGDTDADGDADGDGDGDADGDADTAVTVEVRLLASPRETGMPAGGVTVALDQADDVRLEEETGADGRATFADADLSIGPATVTAYAPGYLLYTRTGIAAHDAVVPLPLLPALRAADFVEVSGAAVGMQDESHNLTVSANAPGGSWEEVGPAWALAVLPELPFTVYAFEWAEVDTGVSRRGSSIEIYAYAMAESDGVTEPTDLTLDFGTGLTGTGFSGSFPVFGQFSRLEQGRPFVNVRRGSAWGAGQLGWVLRGDIDAGEAAFEYTGEFLDLPELDDIVTIYGIADGDVWSSIWVSGPPQDGPQDLEFLEPVRITDPAGARIVLDDDIEWDPPAREAPLLSYLFGATGNLWAIRMPPGTTRLLVPRPPSTITLAEAVEGQAQIYGYVSLCDGSDETPYACTRVTRSRDLIITVQ